MAGFALYISTTNVSTTDDIQRSILCYKDGPQLPPLNFTTLCTKYGRYVIFYNERLPAETYPEEYEIENVYAELCEVIVKGILIKLKSCITHHLGNEYNSPNIPSIILVGTVYTL